VTVGQTLPSSNPSRSLKSQRTELATLVAEPGLCVSARSQPLQALAFLENDTFSLFSSPCEECPETQRVFTTTSILI